MRLSTIFAAFCLVQVAFALAADPQQGLTVLQPTTGGDANRGVTIMSTNGQAVSNACATGNCQNSSVPQAPENTAPLTPPPAGMKAAIVIHPTSGCGCDQNQLQVQSQSSECSCQPQYVEPELKPDPINCTCMMQEECPCRIAYFRSLHGEQSAPIETVAPEQAPNHVRPEVLPVAHLNHLTPCEESSLACQQNQTQYVAPEIKPDCPCDPYAESSCACNSLPSN